MPASRNLFQRTVLLLTTSPLPSTPPLLSLLLSLPLSLHPPSPLSLQPPNQPIPNLHNTILKLRKILRIPLRPRAWHRFFACESHILHVGLVVPGIAVDGFGAVAGGGEGEGGFADEGGAVVAVGVAPDAVDLWDC